MQWEWSHYHDVRDVWNRLVKLALYHLTKQADNRRSEALCNLRALVFTFLISLCQQKLDSSNRPALPISYIMLYFSVFVWMSHWLMNLPLNIVMPAWRWRVGWCSSITSLRMRLQKHLRITVDRTESSTAHLCRQTILWRCEPAEAAVKCVVISAEAVKCIWGNTVRGDIRYIWTLLTNKNYCCLSDCSHFLFACACTRLKLKYLVFVPKDMLISSRHALCFCYFIEISNCFTCIEYELIWQNNVWENVESVDFNRSK